MYVSITQAKAQLEKLIARARQGEEIIICRYGKPKVRVVPIFPQKAERPKRGRPGN